MTLERLFILLVVVALLLVALTDDPDYHIHAPAYAIDEKARTR